MGGGGGGLGGAGGGGGGGVVKRSALVTVGSFDNVRVAVRVLHQNGSLYSKNSILGKTPYVKKLV